MKINRKINLALFPVYRNNRRFKLFDTNMKIKSNQANKGTSTINESLPVLNRNEARQKKLNCKELQLNVQPKVSLNEKVCDSFMKKMKLNDFILN